MPVKWDFSDMHAAYVIQTHSIPTQLSTSLHGQVSITVSGLILYFSFSSQLLSLFLLSSYANEYFGLLYTVASFGLTYFSIGYALGKNNNKQLK